MRVVELTAMCPECDTTMINKCGYLANTENIQVDIAQFEQTEFTCPDCGKTFYTGEMDLMEE